MQFFWRLHTSAANGPKRVWREDWSVDQFEVLTADEFTAFEAMCKRFALALAEADDD